MTTLLQSWLNPSETSHRKANLFAKSYIKIYNRCGRKKKRLVPLSVCIKRAIAEWHKWTLLQYLSFSFSEPSSKVGNWETSDSLCSMLMQVGKSKLAIWKCTNGCFHSLSLFNFNVFHEGKLHQTFNLEWFQTFILISGNRVQVPSFLSCFIYILYFAHSGDIKCHYCGVKNLCELPYDLSTADYINCPKSCMKFDGWGVYMDVSLWVDCLLLILFTIT